MPFMITKRFTNVPDLREVISQNNYFRAQSVQRMSDRHRSRYNSSKIKNSTEMVTQLQEIKSSKTFTA